MALVTAMKDRLGSEELPELRVAVLGDIHGAFRAAAAAAGAAAKALGRVDVVLCVGDVEANRNARDASGVATGRGHRRWVGEFPRVVSGALSFPAPVWFIGGEHEPWHALDVRGPGELAAGFSFLGRAGIKEVGGLRVAFLSGVRGTVSEADLGDRLGRDERCCYVDTELIALKRSARRKGRVDLLVTHDWPAGLVDGRGDAHMAELAVVTEPQLHLCGHHHERLSGTANGVPVEALADIGSPGGWLGLVRDRDGRVRVVA